MKNFVINLEYKDVSYEKIKLFGIFQNRELVIWTPNIDTKRFWGLGGLANLLKI